MPYKDNNKKRQSEQRKRAEAADLGDLPPIRDKKLREACRYDLLLWHREVFPGSTGLKPLGDAQVQSELLAQHCILKGGRIARAEFRGAGKSTRTVNGVIWALAYNHRNFVALFGSSKTKATELAEAIKFELTENEVLFSIFPELCYPFQCLDGFGVKGLSQHINGKPTNVRWRADKIVLPTVDGFAASGNILMVRPINNARGMNHKIQIGDDTTTVRPDFVVLDDIVRDKDADSAAANEKIVLTVKKSILRLGGHSKMLAALLNGTVIEKGDATDQILNDPSWNSVRYKMLVAPSKREDLWLGEYAKRRQTYDKADGVDAQLKAKQRALEYYEQNFELMNEGAKVAWDWAFEWGDDPQTEVSAIQHAYNILIDDGPEAFAAEMQNEPIEKEKPTEADERIPADWYSSRVGRLERGVCPANTKTITCGIDIGKYEIHFCVVAWADDATGRVIDYGSELVGVKRDEDERGIEFKLTDVLNNLYDLWLSDAEYMTTEGELLPIARVYVDCGYQTPLIYRWLKDKQSKRLTPCMGNGDRNIPATLRKLTTKRDRTARYHYRQQERWQSEQRVWLMLIDSSFWRTWARERLTTGENNPGAMRLFRPDEDEFGDHKAWGIHLANEWFGSDGKWHQNYRNHLSDCLSYASAAAAFEGISLMGEVQKKTKSKRIKLSELIEAKKKKRNESNRRSRIG